MAAVTTADGKITTRRVPNVQTVRSLARHEPVLLALKQISGRDFGYDQKAWRGWWEADGRRLYGEVSELSGFDPPAAKQARPAKQTADESPPEAKP